MAPVKTSRTSGNVVHTWCKEKDGSVTHYESCVAYVNLGYKPCYRIHPDVDPGNRSNIEERFRFDSFTRRIRQDARMATTDLIQDEHKWKRASEILTHGTLLGKSRANVHFIFGAANNPCNPSALIGNFFEMKPESQVEKSLTEILDEAEQRANDAQQKENDSAWKYRHAVGKSAMDVPKLVKALREELGWEMTLLDFVKGSGERPPTLWMVEEYLTEHLQRSGILTSPVESGTKTDSGEKDA